LKWFLTKERFPTPGEFGVTMPFSVSHRVGSTCDAARIVGMAQAGIVGRSDEKGQN